MTSTASGCAALTASTVAATVCAVSVSCQRNAEPSRGPSRSRNGDAPGRLRVADVQVGELGERGERRADLGPGREVGAVAQREGGAGLQQAVAVGVDERAPQRRAGRCGAVAATAGQQRRGRRGASGEEDLAPRLHDSSRNPATTGSRTRRRPVSAAAAQESRSRPPATRAIWPAVAPSGRSA